MRVHCYQKPLFSIMAALLILPTSAFIAYGQQGKPTESADEKSKMEFSLRGQLDARAIKYGGWQKFCFKTPGSNTACRTTISGKWDTGQTAVRLGRPLSSGRRQAHRRPG
jgi:hypothetical protein